MSATRHNAEQIAALPLRWDRKNRLRVLIVTSRGRGRWIMPKGRTMDGKKPWQAAKIEALEEAGAVGFVSDQPIGNYHYIKELAKGQSVLCRVTVHPMIVDKLKRRCKEREERKRHWFSLEEAAKLVEEKALMTMLQDLARTPDILTALEDLRPAA
ncbi:NUDIX hydrolase [uncultured Tateyamaria sp.]|uniref:NUDIX hydrolase n=1 Tax=uncultured Tateyamaria sp. TaxID=455651 RepID=UPI002608798E|nr:NUDIX hydrolase [uncultured Tateyamaria sp.]